MDGLIVAMAHTHVRGLLAGLLGLSLLGCLGPTTQLGLPIAALGGLGRPLTQILTHRLVVFAFVLVLDLGRHFVISNNVQGHLRRLLFYSFNGSSCFNRLLIFLNCFLIDIPLNGTEGILIGNVEA